MLNLNELQKYRENNRIEAKSAQGGLPQSIWETYSAFANTQGGHILLGVEELPNKTLHPIGLPNPEKMVTDFWNTINNRQKVSVNILTNKYVQIAEADGNSIIVIEVPRSDRRDKPVYIGADPFAGSYRRNGEGDYHCSKDEVRSMMRDQSDTSQDLRVLEQLDLNAFDYESIRRYRTRLQNLRPGHVWENLEHVEFLQKLGCVGRDDNGELYPTSAGILFFGYEHEIIKEFPNYFLDYQEHENDTTRWTDRIVSNLGDFSGNLFDFYHRVANRLTQEAKTPFRLDGITRIDDTPVHTALREALANALIHADYYGRCGIVIHQSPQQINIANPGNLRISISDAINGGLSDPRNSTLVKLFNLIGVGERAGSGIPNIYSVWASHNWQPPKIEEQFNPERTTLSLLLSQHENKKVAIKSSDKIKVAISEAKKQAVVDYLSINKSCKSNNIAALLDVSISRAKVYLKELISDGIIITEGANRNRSYKLRT
ncbi:MAG: putative DNA binding domain-containing protein [Defluviitaleaceae bacterium]|nr:putative DNA binding domain-containing protein [Defluviitaleaceae bacterium]